MEIHKKQALQDLNTFGIAANADYFCVLQEPKDVEKLLNWQHAHFELPVLLLGGGSNVLFVSDYPGLVVRVVLAGRGRIRAGQ